MHKYLDELMNNIDPNLKNNKMFERIESFKSL